MFYIIFHQFCYFHITYILEVLIFPSQVSLERKTAFKRLFDIQFKVFLYEKTMYKKLFKTNPITTLKEITEYFKT